METDQLSEAVIGAAFEVANTLGAGFLEKVYERALIRELMLQGIRAKDQVSFSVAYKDQCVGQYFADLVVEGDLVVELKCVDRLTGDHTAQCLNYLKAQGKTLCLLLNFQKTRLDWKRVVLKHPTVA